MERQRHRLLPEGPRARIERLALHKVAGVVDEPSWLAKLPPKLPLNIPDSSDGLYVQVVDRDGTDGWWGPIEASAARLMPLIAERLSAVSDVPVGLMVTKLRADWRHSHTGLGACALAALELAAWDLAGRREGRSVASLFGASRHTVIDAYATLFGIDADDPARDRIAAAVTTAGYAVQKWRLPDGPAEGVEGLERNRGRVEALVAAAAPGRIAIECDRAWTPSYLRAFAELCAGPLAWIEEPLPPWEGTAPPAPCKHPLAGGEHTYARHELLALPGLRVLQPDVTFLAGLDEFAASIVSIRENGALCAVHGNGLPAAVAVMAALGDAASGALIEHHLSLEPRRQGLSSAPTIPAAGRIAPVDTPGFGVTPHAACAMKTLDEVRW